MAKVLFGTCGWSDESIKTCGRFYPNWVKTAEQRLQHYSQTFPCVEVDSSTYAIPRPENTRKWAAVTPTGFKFHFKAFGLFTHQSTAANTLPGRVRHLVPAQQSPQQPVSLQQLGPEGEQLVWDTFHAALQPVMQAGKMGCVVFQFQLSFACTAQNWEYLATCRSKLDPSVQMAVEFRNRSWFTDPANAQRLCSWLRQRGICLVSADELQHETYQKDREQQGLPAGQQRRIMPIALHVTTSSFHYVRVHRRHGTTDRLLPDSEIQAWADRITQSLAPSLQRPLYFLWGTDWEDAPLVNAHALTAALPPELRLDWKAHARKLATQARGSIASMFARQASLPAAEQELASTSATRVNLPAAVCGPAICAEGVAASEGLRCSNGDEDEPPDHALPSPAALPMPKATASVAGKAGQAGPCVEVMERSAEAQPVASVALGAQAPRQHHTEATGKRKQQQQQQRPKKAAKQGGSKTSQGQKLLTSYFSK